MYLESVPDASPALLSKSLKSKHLHYKLAKTSFLLMHKKTYKIPPFLGHHNSTSPFLEIAKGLEGFKLSIRGLLLKTIIWPSRFLLSDV